MADVMEAGSGTTASAREPAAPGLALCRKRVLARLPPSATRTAAVENVEAQPPTGLPLTLTFVSRRPVTFRAATPCPETPPKAESDTCTGPIGWSGKPSRLSAFRLRPQVKPEKLRSRKVGR